jgi:hypothetical protein
MIKNNQNGTVSLTSEDLFIRLVSLEKAVQRLKREILFRLPAKYGSDLWWEKEHEKSRRDYEQGNFKSFASAEDLIKDLKSA